MKTIIYFMLITMSAASFSFAQSNDKMHGSLLAKASTMSLSSKQIIKNRGSLIGDYERIYRAELNTDSFDSASTEKGEDSEDVYLAIINDLKSETNHDLEYLSHKLKAEDLPLVMSSEDRKTTSVVIPPFLYFKTQF